MTEQELDQLIRSSMQICAQSPEALEPHRFSSGFERKMRQMLPGRNTSHRSRRLSMKKIGFALIAALLAALGMSLTAVASRTRQVQTFADKLSGYQPLDEQEALLEQPQLTYDLSAIPKRFSDGVEIHCGEQTTQFFHDESSGDFIEFSSYPKMIFRYHLSLPDTNPEPLTLNGKDASYFADQSGIGYVLWSTPSTVLILRSSLGKAELSVIAEGIEVYESG